MGIDFTGSTLALVIVLFAVGLICIIKGGDLFVDAATWIAEASGIPKFIIGATVVSFATTMPEMLVSVFSAFEGNADIAVGNAVGSVTANTGLIMCLSLVCMSCYMTRKQFGVKAGLLLAAVVLLFTFTRDSALSISESIIIMLVFVGFMVESILAAKREQGSEATDERPSTDGKSVAINIGKFILGAAAIVLASGEAVKKYNLKPMAKLVSWGQGGVDPKIMGVGPVPASRQAMQKAGLTIDDIDLVEANEAFAAQSIAVARELGFDMSKVNVNGRAISIGHPVVASGARIIVTLLHEMLKRDDAKKGLATLCIGGGQGVATIFEKC